MRTGLVPLVIFCLVFAGVFATPNDADAIFDFIRGDCNGDGVVFSLIDAIYLLSYGFNGGPAPLCDEAADVDGDGVVFPILDAFYLLNYSFSNGTAPPAPFPGCGPGTNALPCSNFVGC